MRVSYNGITLAFQANDFSSILNTRSNSPIAQLVEQSTVNAWAAGSSPARGATAPSSSFGLGHRPVTAKTWVQIPLGPPY